MSAAGVIYRGGCLCGAVRFEARGPASHLCVCHCASWRRAAGSAGVAWATFVKQNFVLTKGTIAEYRSSPAVTRGFCAHCGSSLTYAHAGRVDDIDVTTASLDEPERLPPTAHIWMQDKLAWEQPGDHLPVFEQTRTDGSG